MSDEKVACELLRVAKELLNYERLAGKVIDSGDVVGDNIHQSEGRHMSARNQARKPFAEYKGRTYKLLYLGPTKYGRKAKLQFMDGSKEFWVDANKVTEKSDSGAQSGSGTQICDNCGGPGARYRRRDSNGIPGIVCRNCARESKYELSFM